MMLFISFSAITREGLKRSFFSSLIFVKKKGVEEEVHKTSSPEIYHRFQVAKIAIFERRYISRAHHSWYLR